MGKRSDAAGEMIGKIKAKTNQGIKVEVFFAVNRKTLYIPEQWVSDRQISSLEISGKNPATLIQRAVEHYRKCVSACDKKKHRERKEKIVSEGGRR